MRLLFTFLKGFLLFCSITACSFCFAQTLVASYPLNGSANDVSGNNLHGSFVGTGVVSSADCNNAAGQAYYFPGGNVYNGIQVPHNALLNPTTALSIRAKFSLTTYNEVAASVGGCKISAVMSKGHSGEIGWYYIGIHSPTSTCAPSSNNKIQFGIRLNDGSTPTVLSNTTVSLNTCYDVTVTYDGSNIRLYVNGLLETTVPASVPLGTNTSPLTMGYHPFASGHHPFNRAISDIKIYSSVLTSNQIFDSYLNDLTKPGSGNALLFNYANSQYADIGNGWDPPGSFSFETWVKRTSLATTDPNFQAFITSVNNNGWGVGINQNSGAGPIGAIYLSKIGVSTVLSTSVINDTKWHHVALTFNATSNQAIFYIDGVADAPITYNAGGFNSSNSSYRLAGRNNNPSLNYLNGSLDEIRIWDGVVLTQSQIRDWMCRKISSAHPVYANLKGYYRLSEGSGTTINSIGTKTGTLVNNPTWVTSGAALGDASVHDYVNATKTASINAATGESFTVTSTSGSPSGIHVYRVDDFPNSRAGANSGGNNKYFGTFQAGGTNPQYTAVYDYSGNPLVNNPLK